jgi:hypothetical protein
MQKKHASFNDWGGYQTMSQNQAIARKSSKVAARSQMQTAAYIAELLQELEALARRDNINELEPLLREARDLAEILAGQK